MGQIVEPIRSDEVKVFYGATDRQNQKNAFLSQEGVLHISPEKLLVSGNLRPEATRSTAVGGAVGSVFGLFGFLVGRGIAEQRARSKLSEFEVDPRNTRAYYDLQSRLVNIELPEGRWLTITPRQGLIF